MAASAPPDAAPSHYETLGVRPDASPRDVTAAYRAAMKRTHPDRVGPAFRAKAEERAKALNAAYRVLSDPARRREYDATLKARTVQDQLMSRYAGGFGTPGSGGADIYGASLRRDQDPFVRREQRQADRSSVVTVLVVFGGATALVVGLLVVAALVQALARAAT